jgi:uncharacterized protein (DUF58 family)
MSQPSRDPEAVLRRLEWKIIRRLDGLLCGDYRTLFRGFGLDLADLREYQFHDDVRHIDWNVTARLQTPYVREYNEDREITAWFLLDVSPSVDFGSTHTRKREVLTGFVGVLARLLTRHGNRVGALLYDGGTENRNGPGGIGATLPPRSGRSQVLHLLDTIARRPELPRANATDLGGFLRAAHNILLRRSLVFLVSDFHSEPGWEDPLLQMTRRHELVAVRLFDPLELELPDLGLVVMQDAETGEQIFVDTHDKGFRRRFAAEAASREAHLRSALQRAGVDALELSTADDLLDSILRFADLRRLRSRWKSGALPAHLEVMP